MVVNRGTVCENVPADITDTSRQYRMRAMLQEMDTCLLVAQNHYVAQYLTPQQQVNLTLDCPAVRGVPRRHAR